MLNKCRLSCKACNEAIEELSNDDVNNLADNDDKDSDNNDGDEDQDDDNEEEEDDMDLPAHISLAHGADMGKVQVIEGDYDARPQDLAWVIAKARSYMTHLVPKKLGKDMQEFCRNKHALCAYWAWKGECDENPQYMRLQCAPVCQSCHNLTLESRCPLDPNEPNAWGPGDLNRMFEQLTSEPYLSTYDVRVLSSPTMDKPWVITMENFVTEEEAKRLIELGHMMGYKRSTDVGKRRADGTYTKKVSEDRTSTNTWCADICAEDPVAIKVFERLSQLTGIPSKNSEPLQLLRYDVGELYRTHHDMIEHQVTEQAGPRILTAFIYLNDVEQGGGTHFEELNVTVLPSRGRVLIWPNVYDNDPNKKDWRTIHEALPVEKGIKFGANAWFHLRDNQTPNARGCTA